MGLISLVTQVTLQKKLKHTYQTQKLINDTESLAEAKPFKKFETFFIVNIFFFAFK